MDFLILIYLISAAVVGWKFWTMCLRDEPYITAKEAIRYAGVTLIPFFNTLIACAIFWEAIDDVVLWRRK